MNRTPFLAGFVFLLAAQVHAVDKGKAKYTGGTLSLKEKTEAPIDLKGPERLTFTPQPKDGAAVTITWANVNEVEYGQKVGHRIKTAILLSPLSLFSKSRHHFVTLSFTDDAGAEQAAVFEFDKDDIRAVLAIIRARSGKEITFQDEEARKQMGGTSKAPAVAASPTPTPEPTPTPQ